MDARGRQSRRAVPRHAEIGRRLPFDSVAVYVVTVVFAATLIRSTLGFGEALVAVPLLALRIPVAVAAPLAVLVSVVVAAAIVAQDREHVEFRAARRLVVASVAGIPLGLLLLAKADDHAVKMVLGAIIAVFSLYSLSARQPARLAGDHDGWLLACGFVAGILGGAYGMNGPPLVVYGGLRRWPPRQFRATLQGYFLPASVMGAAGYLSIGLWTGVVTRYFLWSLPGVAVAILLGRRLNARMTSGGFFRVVYGGLLLIAATLLVQATQG